MAKSKKKVTEYRNYYLPMNFPVLLLHGDYWKISDVPSERLHFHNCLEIGLCHSESGIIQVMGDNLPFKAGDITVIPRNILHTTYSNKGQQSHWSYLFIEPQELFRNVIPKTWLDYDLMAGNINNYQYIYHQKDNPVLYSILQSAISELKEKKPYYELSVKGYLLTFYTELYRYRCQTASKNSSFLVKEDPLSENGLIISPALNYIEDHYMQNFTIDLLADLCHWSPTHFRRVFHEIMNTSPLDFINDTRVIKSCSLLRSTEYPILEISGMVGFHSVSSYNRCFYKVMQQTPSEYRKLMLQSDKRNENTSILEYAGWMFPENITK